MRWRTAQRQLPSDSPRAGRRASRARAAVEGRRRAGPAGMGRDGWTGVGRTWWPPGCPGGRGYECRPPGRVGDNRGAAAICAGAWMQSSMPAPDPSDYRLAPALGRPARWARCSCCSRSSLFAATALVALPAPLARPAGRGRPWSGWSASSARLRADRAWAWSTSTIRATGSGSRSGASPRPLDRRRGRDVGPRAAGVGSPCRRPDHHDLGGRGGARQSLAGLRRTEPGQGLRPLDRALRRAGRADCRNPASEDLTGAVAASSQTAAARA